MTKLPSLNAIRAFEATARFSSVTLAAAELHVTPGAVSKQLRELEESLATTLLVRAHHEMRLTQAGEDYFRSASRAFSDLRDATSRLRRRSQSPQLRIRAYTTFSMRWLIPRLPDFYSRHPGIEVTLTTSLDDVDFDREDLDGAIRLGDGHWPGVSAVKLVPNLLTPVASASFLQNHRVGSPADLGACPLLHSLARPTDWSDWLQAAQVAGVDGTAGTLFQTSAMAYAAAAQGQGVAMAQLFLVADALKSGELLRLFPFALDMGPLTYYLLTPNDRLERPSMSAFRDWMLEQFKLPDPQA
ncbi:MAG TPA: transcriptional regulator GcvA [Pseudorhodoferax sp.]|nr:transcriptional regulator GcvA [Pseudorhodoferax sp.]